MKKAFFILFLLISIVSCKPKGNVWTKEYEQKQFDDINKQLESFSKDPTQRRLFTTYIIQNFKKKLPLGLESVSADSLHKISEEIGRQYTLHNQYHGGIAWTAATEAAFRKEVETQVYAKMPDQQKRDAYCDCLMASVKRHYPDSLQIPIPSTVMETIVADCTKK